jgi:hypothetical protein
VAVCVADCSVGDGTSPAAAEVGAGAALPAELDESVVAAAGGSVVGVGSAVLIVVSVVDVPVVACVVSGLVGGASVAGGVDSTFVVVVVTGSVPDVSVVDVSVVDVPVGVSGGAGLVDVGSVAGGGDSELVVVVVTGSVPDVSVACGAGVVAPRADPSASPSDTATNAMLKTSILRVIRPTATFLSPYARPRRTGDTFRVCRTINPVEVRPRLPFLREARETDRSRLREIRM